MTLEETIQTLLRGNDRLRKPEFRGGPDLRGHCYVASEVYYHAMGGEGLTPETVRHEGGVHWYLRQDDGLVVDLTAEQFTDTPPYSKGRGRGFLTKKPSKRAQEILVRMEEIVI